MLMFVHGVLGSTLTSCSRVTEQVGALIAAVDQRQGFAGRPAGPGRRQLHWGGKVLSGAGRRKADRAGVRRRGAADDSRSLASVGLAAGATLEVVVPLRGGAQCGKMVKGRSKEKSGEGDDLAAKMAWLQEQARKRIAARDALKAVRDRARAEAEMTRKNMLKIMAAMRDMMRGEKLDALRRELEALAAAHDEAVSLPPAPTSLCVHSALPCSCPRAAFSSPPLPPLPTKRF